MKQKFLLIFFLLTGFCCRISAQVQLLADTTLGQGGWISTSTHADSVICGGGCGNCGGPCVAHSGTYFAWFGGTTQQEVGTLTQTFNVPNAGNSMLRFWAKIPAVGFLTDSIKVILDGSMLWFRNGEDTAGFKTSYGKVELFPGVLSAGTHTLEFRGKESGISSMAYNVLIDDITLWVGGTIGTEEYDLSEEVFIYTGEESLIVSYPQNEGNLYIRITDISGRTMAYRESSSASVFSTNGWSPGIYIVLLQKKERILARKIYIGGR